MPHLGSGKSVAGQRDTYVVEAEVGAGTYGTVFHARRRDGGRALLEEVHLGALDEWATLEVCIREAGLLRRLSDPRLVTVSELFAWDGEVAREAGTLLPAGAPARPLGVDGPLPSLVIVRDCPRGESLAAAIADGRRFTSAELEGIYRDGLGALGYLHALSPAVVHRDLSAESLIVGEDAAAITGLRLSPRDGAGPSDDLWQLAATIVYAAAHVEPAQLSRRMAAPGFQLGALVPNLSPRLRRALAASLDVVAARRPRTAGEVLDLLDARRFAVRSALRALRTVPRPARLGAVAALGGAAIGLGLTALAGASSPAEVPVAEVSAAPPLALEAEPPAATCPASPVCPEAPVCPAERVCPTEQVCPEAPAAAPSTVTRLAPLVWTARALDAHGLDLGKRCTLEVRAETDGSEVTGCTTSVRCDGATLLASRSTDTCALRQTRLAGGSSRYDVWLTARGGREDGEAGTEAIAVDASEERIRYWRYAIDGEPIARATLVLEGASIPSEVTSLGPMHFEGTSKEVGVVTTVKGETGLSIGTRCSLTLEPLSQASDTCDATVRCGPRLLYHQAGQCDVNPLGKPRVFYDTTESVHDDSPTLSLEEHILRLDDLGPAGPTSIEITMPSEPGDRSADDE